MQFDWFLSVLEQNRLENHALRPEEIIPVDSRGQTYVFKIKIA